MRCLAACAVIPCVLGTSIVFGSSSAGCSQNNECPSGHFCQLPTGQCGGPGGQCQQSSDICPADYAPICGCDGQTYSNACRAAASGVSVSRQNECGSSPSTHRRLGEAWLPDENESAVQPNSEIRRCGSRGLPSCADEEFCEFRGGNCGYADMPGFCTPQPFGCPRIYRPICGCDGKTYVNDCVAQSGGVSIRSEGACEDADQTDKDPLPAEDASAAEESRSIASVSVDARQSAGHELTDLSAVAQFSLEMPVGGEEGELLPRPALDEVSKPWATSERKLAPEPQDKQHEKLLRAITERPPAESMISCGGLIATQCPDGQVCIFSEGTCGAADETGTCIRQPFFCTLMYQPVCGCDGRTYSNACHAHSQGVSIMHLRSCEGESEANSQATASQALHISSQHLRKINALASLQQERGH